MTGEEVASSKDTDNQTTGDQDSSSAVAVTSQSGEQQGEEVSAQLALAAQRLALEYLSAIGVLSGFFIEPRALEGDCKLAIGADSSSKIPKLSGAAFWSAVGIPSGPGPTFITEQVGWRQLHYSEVDATSPHIGDADVAGLERPEAEAIEVRAFIEKRQAEVGRQEMLGVFSNLRP